MNDRRTKSYIHNPSSFIEEEQKISIKKIQTL